MKGNPNLDLPTTDQEPELQPHPNANPTNRSGSGSFGGTLGRLRRNAGQSSEATGTFTKWVPGGDPEDVAALFGGLLVLVLGIYAGAMKRRGGYFRMPSEEERDDIVTPLGRIATRRLPMHLIVPDLKDVAESGAATHAYVKAGPLRRKPIDAQPLDIPEG